MSSLIACPGCSHKLMLPANFAGQRVQCPQCLLEFAAQATLIPLMEVEPVVSTPAAEADPAVQTGYAALPMAIAQASAVEGPSVFCRYCGTKCFIDEDDCPDCGQPIRDLPEEFPRDRRRPRARVLQPLQGSLPIFGAILLVAGLVLMIAAPIMAEALRREARPVRDLLPLLLLGAGGVVTLTAQVLVIIWLYQAWRVVMHGDEEYTPGLMVGLLFVPFFNFYWIFRVVPGLSLAIQKELRYVAPRRNHGAGWAPGLFACIVALIPYAQPIAVCIFLAWMLIANSALHRLIRYHDELRAEEAARQASDPEA